MGAEEGAGVDHPPAVRAGDQRRRLSRLDVPPGQQEQDDGDPEEGERQQGQQDQRHGADPAAHPYRLFAVKRCPACATRLGRRAVRQSCEACGFTPLDDARFVHDYVAFIDRRVPLACLACFLLGLVPVLGVIPAVITYRLAIVAPFRRSIPAGRNFLLRWGVRLVSILLVAFQWVPLLGGLLLPALALINYGAYRHTWIKLARADTDRER
jgi:hypothetical protein